LGVDGRPLRVVAGGGPARVALVAAAAGLGWALLACLPLPRGLVGVCSPATLQWRAPEPPGDPPAFLPIALAPDASMGAVWRAAAAIMCGWVALQVVRRSADALWILGPVGVGGALAAGYGVAGVLSGGALTAWHTPVGATAGARAHAPFVNPNHLATACALALPCLAAMVWWRRKGSLHASGGMALRIAGVGAILVTLAGLVATLSRGGALAALGGAAVFALLARPARAEAPARGAGWRLGVPVAAAAGLFVLAFGLEPLLARFADVGGDGVQRAAGWRMALAMWGDFPVFGAGAGTFGALSRAYQPADVAGTWDAAHCDWLDLAARGGLPALAAGLVVLFAVAVGCWRVRHAGVRTARRMAVAAAGAGLAALAWHAVVDFPLQMPALAASGAALAGLALAGGDTAAAREELASGGAA
jgi:hypothetical protein